MQVYLDAHRVQESLLGLMRVGQIANKADLRKGLDKESKNSEVSCTEILLSA